MTYTIAIGERPTINALDLVVKVNGANMAAGLREDWLKFWLWKTTPSWFHPSGTGTGRPDLYASLISGSDPGETGTQLTNEASYTGYSRALIARSTSSWTIADAGSGDWSGKNTNAIHFGRATATGGGLGVDYVGIGTAASGAGNLLMRIPINSSGTSLATNQLEFDILSMVLQGLAPTWDGSGWTYSGDVRYASLHTASAGVTGTQLTNEVDPASVVGYARGQFLPTSQPWTLALSGGDYQGTSVADIQAYSGSILSGTATGTNFGVGTSSTGAGRLLLIGALTNNVALASGGTPTFFAGDLKFTQK